MFFDRVELLKALDEAGAAETILLLRQRMLALKGDVLDGKCKVALDPSSEGDEHAVSLRGDVLVAEIQQIVEAYTLERARHYLRRLRTGIAQARDGDVNDINLGRWKEYDDIITDSLWVVERRDTSGAHLGWYWGNYIPQIPHQMMVRYTRRHDWVLDAFVGSGTTLIECKRLG
ncbi:MAG: DNA methyltransferase, partial [Chloroflexi bacterium]|nr:DNA methyltransferase [Chloroflexota bacterium]